MKSKSRGYFLLDAVLATLIMSILLSVVLFSLQISLKAFRKSNEYIHTLYFNEEILYKKLLLSDFFPDQGVKSSPYGDFSWSIETEEYENIKRIDVSVINKEKLQGKLSSFIIN